MALVKLGDKGDAVGSVQADLIWLHHLDINGLDRHFGKATEDAVKAFQAANGLSSDGIVGPDTRTAMKNAVAALPAPTPSPDITEEQLQALMHSLGKDKLAAYLEPLNAALREFGIITAHRKAAFVSQVAWESNELKDWTERGNDGYFQKYEPGTSKGHKLGNTEIGDGPLYKGRGPLQLTGRGNYTACKQALGVDIVGNPSLVSDDASIGFRAACWYWDSKRINVAADAGSLEKVTYLINGSTDTVPKRKQAYEDAMRVLKA